MGTDGFRSFNDFFICGIKPAETDIFFDCAVKEEGVLQYNAHLAAKTGLGHFADVDPIDWIELIPYPSSRNYVQRVLENLQVYRHRLGVDPQARNLQKDLRR